MKKKNIYISFVSKIYKKWQGKVYAKWKLHLWLIVQFEFAEELLIILTDEQYIVLYCTDEITIKKIWNEEVVVKDIKSRKNVETFGDRPNL